MALGQENAHFGNPTCLHYWVSFKKYILFHTSNFKCKLKRKNEPEKNQNYCLDCQNVNQMMNPKKNWNP